MFHSIQEHFIYLTEYKAKKVLCIFSFYQIKYIKTILKSNSGKENNLRSLSWAEKRTQLLQYIIISCMNCIIY